MPFKLGLDDDEYHYYEPPFVKYEPAEKANKRFNFLDKVKTSHFCGSHHVQNNDGKLNRLLAFKVIELFENEDKEKEFVVIGRTRLHIGKLYSGREYSDYGEEISGQNYLQTERAFTVYILSDGFGTQYKALSEHCFDIYSNESINKSI